MTMTHKELMACDHAEEKLRERLAERQNRPNADSLCVCGVGEGSLRYLCDECVEKAAQYDALYDDMRSASMGVMALLGRMEVLPCDPKIRTALTAQFVEHLKGYLPKHLREKWDQERVTTETKGT